MAGAMTHVNYVSDDGATYRVRMDSSNATDVGNPAATVSAHLPGGYHPRYINCTHPTTGRERKVIISSPTNALWVGGTSTVDLWDFTTNPSDHIPYAVLSRVGEKRLNQG
jgi:hypothetical protein